MYVGKNFHKKVLNELKENGNQYLKVLAKTKITYEEFKVIVDYFCKEDKHNGRLY